MLDWPRVPDFSLCTEAALYPEEQEGQLRAAAHKITAALASAETALLAIPEYAGVQGARIALECVRTAGARLFTEAPAVNEAASDALVAAAEAAIERLHPLEERARAAREVEKLRLFAAASAALHRELQAFRDLDARLRGAKGVPRSVALDPAAARAPRPESDDLGDPGDPDARNDPALASEDLAPARGARFLDPPASKGRVTPRRLAVLGALLAILVVSTVRAIFFSRPTVVELAPPSAEIVQVRVSGPSAMVTVRAGFSPSHLPGLVATLLVHEVTSAAILREDGSGVGQLDVKSGKLYGAAGEDAGESDAGER